MVEQYSMIALVVYQYNKLLKMSKYRQTYQDSMIVNTK